MVSQNYKVQHLQIQQRHKQKLIENNRTKNKNRILIVDNDSPDNNTTLRLDLEQNGFIVKTFTNPLFALNHFQGWFIRYDCIG